MKNFTIRVMCIVMCITVQLTSFAQGTSCVNAIDLNPLINQGSSTFNFTNSMEPSVLNCTRGTGNPFTVFYQGTGRVIYFRFTYTGQCISILSTLNITAVLEGVMLVAGCQQTAYQETVCFNDGYGFWAINSPNGGFAYTIGTTYYLKYRLQTGMNGQLTINATTPTITNSNCPNPTPITTTPTLYNNSCNQPTTSLQPGGVCALSLENTAWYSYTIQGNSNDLLNVSAINCDNYESNTGDWGYQLGIFTGGCGVLQHWGPCFQAESGSLQWSLAALPVGTTIHVAIDGLSGSNCIYYIWVGTEPAPLPIRWGVLVGIAENNYNKIRWSTLSEMNSKWFVVERSMDGSRFVPVDTITAAHETKEVTWYNSIDSITPAICYYRVKAVDIGEKFIYSSIVKVQRGMKESYTVKVKNPVEGSLKIFIQCKKEGRAKIELMMIDGRMGWKEFSNEAILYTGTNNLEYDMSRMAAGFYVLKVTMGEEMQAFKLVKK